MHLATAAFMSEPTLCGSATTGKEARHGSMGTSERSDGREVVERTVLKL